MFSGLHDHILDLNNAVKAFLEATDPAARATLRTLVADLTTKAHMVQALAIYGYRVLRSIDSEAHQALTTANRSGPEQPVIITDGDGLLIPATAFATAVKKAEGHFADILSRLVPEPARG